MEPFAFIPPASPRATRSVPTGPEWLHEPKSDGWRAQVHKLGSRVAIFSKRGLDLTRQFPSIASAVATMSAASLVLDAELVALDGDGKPDFLALHRRRPLELRLFAFDVLHLDGLDVRDEPLDCRKALLATQISRHGHAAVRNVETFDDGRVLLQACERMGLEGIVSKRRADPYRPGPRCGWRKTKTAAWRAVNAERWRLFERT